MAQVPGAAQAHVAELRRLVRAVAPKAEESLSYGVVGYRPVPKKRAHAFISGWKDHVAVYPVPKDEELEAELQPYRRGKGTLWFPLDTPLPADLITRTFQALMG